MFSQKKDKEAAETDLTRKKMLVLASIEEKIKSLHRKVEELSDKTALSIEPVSQRDNFNNLIMQTKELMSIYLKIKSQGEQEHFRYQEMMTPAKEHLDSLEKVREIA